MPKYQSIDLQFPLAGLDVSQAFVTQKATVTPLGASYDQSFQQQRFETTRSAVNVRGFDVIQGRFRGGSRPGLVRYAQNSNSGAYQCLATVVTAGITPPGGTQPASRSGRVVTLLMVDSAGTIAVLSQEATTWINAINGASAMANAAVTSGMVQAAQNVKGVTANTPSTTFPAIPQGGQGWVYFADGVNYKKYDLSTNTVSTWAAMTGSGGATTGVTSGGTLPAVGADKPRLICTWRGRVVLSGIKTDPQNWFMSRVMNPCDFNYSPLTVTSTQAVAGNNSSLGMVGDVVNALVPINDDNLLFLCDHSVWIMRGDPMAGGQLTQLEPGIGGAWGAAWCVDTEGVVYWLSNQAGVYQFSQFDYPRRISQRIDPLLRQIDTGKNIVRMVWDDYMQGFHLFVTDTAAQAGNHFFWEKRTGAWWQDQFANPLHNPTACCLFDGNLKTDRRALVGCLDGVVRSFEPSAVIDDGSPVVSNVLIGPIASGTSELMLRDLKAVLAGGPGQVTWQLFAGDTAEEAFGGGHVVASGTLSPGSNKLVDVRCAGKALYLRLTCSTQWAVERIRASVADLGRIRARA